MFARYSGLVFVLVLVAALLSPAASLAQTAEIVCGTDEDAVVTIAGGTAIERQIDRVLADRFMKACPNITINILDDPELDDDRLGYYLQRFDERSSNLDVLQIDVVWPAALAEHLVDLTPYLSEDDIAAHFPNLIEANTVDGRLVGIPWYMEAGLLYYRQDLLDKYGLELPETWDELEETARIIQDGERAEGNGEFWGYVWQGTWYEGLTCNALEWQYAEGGGTIVSPEGEIQVNNEGTIRAIDRAARWVGTISPADTRRLHEGNSIEIWLAGNAAFLRHWPNAYGSSNAEGSQVKDLFGVAALPRGASGKSAGTLSGMSAAVSKYARNIDAAAAVAVYMTGYEQQKERAIVGSLNPTIMALYQDEDVLEAVPIFESLYDAFVNAVARPSTATGKLYPEVSQMYFSSVYSVIAEGANAADEMALLEFDLRELLE